MTPVVVLPVLVVHRLLTTGAAFVGDDTERLLSSAWQKQYIHVFVEGAKSTMFTQ